MTIRITHEALSEVRAAERETAAEVVAYRRAEAVLTAAVRGLVDATEERYLSAESRAALGDMAATAQALLDDAVLLARSAHRVADVVSEVSDRAEEMAVWGDTTQTEHDTMSAPAGQAAE